ncbi:MAG: hypothetical protein NTV94_13935 [Planctomycetota bacterium]|nr:hypothetical protein [Planctomycetota bacterium]
MNSRSLHSSLLLVVGSLVMAPGCEQQDNGELLATVTSQRDAIELTSALEQSNIPGVRLDRVEGGIGTATYSVRCPPAAAAYARIVMTELGLPREHAAAQSSAGSSLFPTRADDVARELARRGEDLEVALTLLEGIATVHVQVATPAQEDPLSSKMASPNLLVVVRTVGPLEPSREELLRDRVSKACSASFAGLDVQRRLTLLISGRDGVLASPAAKAAIAAAKRANPTLEESPIQLSVLSRYIVPLSAIVAVCVLGALAMRDRWRAMLAR